MNFRKETSRFEVFMDFPRPVESAVTTVTHSPILRVACGLTENRSPHAQWLGKSVADCNESTASP